MLPSRMELERAAASSWPASVVAEAGGWLLRATPGVTGRRLNSALPLVDAPCIEAVEAFYASRGLVSRVQVSPLGDRSRLDRSLAALGWTAEATTDVLCARTASPGGCGSAAPGVSVERVSAAAWADAWRALGDAARTAEPAATDVVRRIPYELLPLVARRQRSVVGVGLAVLHERTSIVFGMAVHEDHRRQGIATQLMRAWAAGAGPSRTLFLQVLRTNEPALRLYERLGFSRSHRYHYRTAGNAAG